MLTAIQEYLKDHIVLAGSDMIVDALLLFITAFTAWVCYHATRFLLTAIEKIVLTSASDWDDDLITPRFLRAVSQLAPAICVHLMLPKFFGDSPTTYRLLSTLTMLYIVIAVVYGAIVMISNIRIALAKREALKRYAVKGVFQMVKIVVIGFGVIVSVSIVLGISPAVIMTSLGASAAVLMLVFKDTILGLVASVQLTANKMVEKGDWIVSDNHNINGEVLDVSLNTIKVRNWDNSVSTIPPYTLVSESFRNYERMRQSGGRRATRSFYVDANSVRFLTPEEIEILRTEGWLEGIDTDAQHTVNLGLLRFYLGRYLEQHPGVAHDKLCMVRQLQPTPSGLPMELYFFTSTVEWEEYERIQSAVFDHVYAVVHRFGLRVFQTPAGTDFERVGNSED